LMSTLKIVLAFDRVRSVYELRNRGAIGWIRIEAKNENIPIEAPTRNERMNNSNPFFYLSYLQSIEVIAEANSSQGSKHLLHQHFIFRIILLLFATFEKCEKCTSLCVEFCLLAVEIGPR